MIWNALTRQPLLVVVFQRLRRWDAIIGHGFLRLGIIFGHAAQGYQIMLSPGSAGNTTDASDKTLCPFSAVPPF